MLWDGFLLVMATYYITITSASCQAMTSGLIWYHNISVSLYSFAVASPLINESVRKVLKVY